MVKFILKERFPPRYKTPFLRGDMDPGIDTYQRIEELIASDIDHWLCNLYFEVVLLPR